MKTAEAVVDVEWGAKERPPSQPHPPAVTLTRILAGQPLFKKGDPWGDMYIVKDGVIGIFINGRMVETVAASGILGEMSLIDKTPRSATAVALTEAVLMPINESQFHGMIRHTPSFAIMVMRVMCKRLRQMDVTQ
ncbi:MAG: Crp/Fnr family transcriptional regulator [Limisphaerales bacterium]